MANVGLQAAISLAVTALVAKVKEKAPDHSHKDGKLILDAFVWDEIAALAKGKSEDAWARLGLAEPPRNEPLEKTVMTSPHFEINAKVTQPVKRFNADALATILFDSHKIPKAECLGYVEKAKVGDKGNLYWSIKLKEK